MTGKQLKSMGCSAAVLVAGIWMASLSGGCADTSAKRVETGGPESIRTVDQIDDQDWSEAATKMTKSMLAQDNLFPPKSDGGKQVLEISRIINNTSQNVDTDLLVKKIRVVLNQSGKVVTQTTDMRSRDVGNLTNFMDDKEKVIADYRLSGKMIENRAKAGDIRQSTFYFQLSLTDKAGNDIWENEIPITKIGSHNAVGL
ncbi:MAG TPA: hypothetical protein VLI90_02525 [Tepidisphaeraceae bacterium]|nr:hypothetical protein [Tepidisphaeraceae bacterium]